MGRTYFVTLEHVAGGDECRSLRVGQRLDLPRQGRVECGRVDGADIVCRGRGQGGRRCFVLDSDGPRVVIRHLGHALPMVVRGELVAGDHELFPGDGFGPCEGIRFVLGAEPGPVLFGAAAVGPYLCVNPRGEPRSPVYSGFHRGDPSRLVVDVVRAAPLAGNLIRRGVAERLPPHPSWPALIALLQVGDALVRVSEAAAGVTLERIVARTRAAGAEVDGEMAAWLVESVGRALERTSVDDFTLDPHVVVRFDDGQPMLLPHQLLFTSPAPHGAGPVAALLRSLVAPDALGAAVARAAAAALGPDASAAELGALLDALAEVRIEPDAAVRNAWHGLVQRLFPDECDDHAEMVEALRVLDDDAVEELLAAGAR